MKPFKIKRLIVLLIVVIFLVSSTTVISVIPPAKAKEINNNIKEKFSELPKLPTHKAILLNQNHSSEEINPYLFYSQEPAPMGIADYGIGPNGQPYAYETPAFLGIVNVNSLNTYNSSLNQSANWMSFQLNVNLVFENDNSLYAYWVQDVVHVNTTNNYVNFIDNIWNDSSIGSNMYNSTVLGNGTVANSGGTGFYYCFANQYLPGNDVYLPYPYTIQFEVFSYINAQGYPAVAFLYNDGYGWVTYDNVVFIFANDLTSYPNFLVDGYQYEPDGDVYDAELILGGPWNGYQTYDVDSSLSLQLELWNGNNFQMVPNAYNFGSHTAEGISNVISVLATDLPENGSFSAYEVNGNGQLGVLYQSNELSYLWINLPINSGVLYVNNTPYQFYNKGLYIPLFPSSYQTNLGWHSGYYTLYLYNNQGQLLWESNVNLIANQTLIINLYNVTFTETGLPAGTGWWVNITNGLSTYSNTNTINILEENGTFTYSISSTNKDYYSNGGTFTINGNNLVINVQFTLKTYTLIFIESGLPNGTQWSVTINGNTFSSNTNSIVLTEPNGTYAYSISNPISGGAGIQYATYKQNGIAIINGGNVNINIIYIKQYYLSMNNYPINSGIVTPESGWYNLSSIISIKAIPNSNFEFVSWTGIGNGSYSGANNPAIITMNGPITETANYIEIYNVNIIETGLPTGTIWFTNLSNGQSFNSKNNTISFKEPNGTYSYLISTVNKEYAPSQSYGSFTINGENVNIAVPFYLVTYKIIFTENGLPLGTQWSVTLNGIIHNSTTNMIIFNEPNGSYSYTLMTPINGSLGARYITLSPSGTVNVNGANVTIAVSYQTQYYLTMIANPSNGGSVSPTSGWYNAGSSVTINEIPNSNYEFVSWTGTGTGSFSGTSTQATVTMNGPITEQANFNELFQVTFTENSLPPGTTWYVNLSNGQAYSSTTNTISFNEPNGTYSYTIATGNKDYSPTQYSGSFTVNGAPVSESITFNLVTYKITFTESGLSSGTTWYVTLNGTTKSSSNNTIIFNEPNGSYAYTIQGISGYRANTYSGTITINGNPIDENITWSVILYPITITENGIPNGTSWSATITGMAFNGQYVNITLSSTTNTITFNEPNGTYSYSIHLPSGYNGNNLKGTVDLVGSSVTSSVKAYQTTNYLVYAIIGVIAIIAIVGAVFAMKSRKRKKGNN